MWRGACFAPSVDGFKEKDFSDNLKRDLAKQSWTGSVVKGKKTRSLTQTLFSATVSIMPEFTIAAWEPTPKISGDDGLSENGCWPKKIAPKDPGFVLLNIDRYYGDGANHQAPPYDYAAKYDPPNNGV
jgi:hypothetical protein